MKLQSSRDGACRQGLSIQFLSHKDHAHFAAHQFAQIAGNPLPQITLQFLTHNTRKKGAQRNLVLLGQDEISVFCRESHMRGIALSS